MINIYGRTNTIKFIGQLMSGCTGNLLTKFVRNCNSASDPKYFSFGINIDVYYRPTYLLKALANEL